MNLLGAVLYDPATAVTTKSTASLLAMTAFDTTNLRVTVTVPSHGMLFFRIFGGSIVGATTVPTILLGVLNGATVVGRVAPRDFPGTMNATTQTTTLDCEFVATGLAAGSTSFDLAYAVQVVVASTAIKYGGPNNASGANAWGGIAFEVWDPQPLTTALAGGVNVKQWNGTNVATPATAGIPDVNAKNINNVATSSVTTINANVGQTQPVNFTGTAGSALVKSDMVDIAGQTVTAAAGVTFPTSVASPTNITAGTITTTTNLTNLPSIPANWITAAGINAAALNGKGDWNIGKTGYSLTQTFPTNFSSLAITVGGAVTAGTVSDKTGYSLTTADWAKTGDAMTLTAAYDAAKTALAASAYTAPDNTGIGNIKTQTDKMAFTVANQINANITYVNAVQVNGLGTQAVPWGP